MSNKSKHKNIESLANTNPFSAPKGYFDSFSERIMDRINQEDLKQKPSLGFIRFLRPAFILSVSFIIIFLIIMIQVKIITPKTIADKNERNNQNIEYLYYYLINDHAIYEALEEEVNNDYDEAIVETFLLASVSEIDLLEL